MSPPRVAPVRMADTTLRSDDRAVSETIALGVILGSAIALALALGAIMLLAGAV